MGCDTLRSYPVLVYATISVPVTTIHALDAILNATRPEEIFGALTTGSERREVQERYRQLGALVHPDHCDDARADEAMAKLNIYYRAARKAVDNGSYAKRPVMVDAVTIRTRRHTYRVNDFYAAGDCTNVYAATYADDEGEHDGLVKIVRNPRDGDLVSNEARTLKTLLSDPATFDDISPYISGYKEAFAYKPAGERKARQGIAFTRMPNLYTLTQVREHYPGGVSAKDAAWMFRRLLMALGFTHQMGIVHGAVLPEHVLIEPDLHGLVLIDWKHSVPVGGVMTAIPSGHQEFYPDEVMSKEPATAATDIFMAAQVMRYVMGMDAARPEMLVPRQIRSFMRGTALPVQSRRPQDAFELKDEYDELIERLWGPRRFRPFSMTEGR